MELPENVKMVRLYVYEDLPHPRDVIGRYWMPIDDVEARVLKATGDCCECGVQDTVRGVFATLRADTTGGTE